MLSWHVLIRPITSAYIYFFLQFQWVYGILSFPWLNKARCALRSSCDILMKKWLHYRVKKKRMSIKDFALCHIICWETLYNVYSWSDKVFRRAWWRERKLLVNIYVNRNMTLGNVQICITVESVHQKWKTEKSACSFLHTVILTEPLSKQSTELGFPAFEW